MEVDDLSATVLADADLLPGHTDHTVGGDPAAHPVIAARSSARAVNCSPGPVCTVSTWAAENRCAGVARPKDWWGGRFRQASTDLAQCGGAPSGTRTPNPLIKSRVRGVADDDA
jgi:hypothetical protein